MSETFTVELAAEGIGLVEAGAPAVSEGHLHVLADVGCYDSGEVMPGPSDEDEAGGRFHLGEGSDSRDIALEPGSIDIPMTKALLEHHGLHATSSLGLTFDADISSADDVVGRRGQERLEAALGVARGIGASYLGGVIYWALGKYAQWPPPRVGRTFARLRELAG